MIVERYWCVECMWLQDDPKDVEDPHAFRYTYQVEHCEQCGYAHMHFTSTLCEHHFPMCRYDVTFTQDVNGYTVLDIDRVSR